MSQLLGSEAAWLGGTERGVFALPAWAQRLSQALTEPSSTISAPRLGLQHCPQPSRGSQGVTAASILHRVPHTVPHAVPLTPCPSRCAPHAVSLTPCPSHRVPHTMFLTPSCHVPSRCVPHAVSLTLSPSRRVPHTMSPHAVSLMP